MIELHEIMRQKDDKQFAETLNRIRTSNHTDDDVQLIKSREIQNTSTLYPSTALHIFAFYLNCFYILHKYIFTL